MPVDPSAPRNVKRYEGQWLEGKQHGVGYYYQADGSRLFSFLLFFLRIESHLLFHPSLSPFCSAQPFILRRREELLANALIILFLKCFLQSACLVLLSFVFFRAHFLPFPPRSAFSLCFLRLRNWAGTAFKERSNASRVGDLIDNI